MSKYNSEICILAKDSRKNWRKEIYPMYKANRKDQRQKSTIDFDVFFKIFDSFYNDMKRVFTNIYFMEIDKSEADDIIAVITEELKDNSIVNISTDGDLLQLYKFNNYRQYNPIKKQFSMNINPKKFLLCKILSGDRSDNISPIKKRVGIKTAEKIINEGLEDYLDKEELHKEFDINKSIIDLNCIPIEYKLQIKDIFNNYDLKKPKQSDIYNFFINHKLRYFLENINLVTKTLNGLKC